MPVNQQYLAQLFGNPMMEGSTRGVSPNPYMSAPGQETFHPAMLDETNTPMFDKIPQSYAQPVQDMAVEGPASSVNNKQIAAGMGLLSNQLMQQSQPEQPQFAPVQMPQGGGQLQLANNFSPYMAGMLARRR